MSSIVFDQGKFTEVRNSGKLSELAIRFWEYAYRSFGTSNFDLLSDALEKRFGKAPWQLKTPEEFLIPEVMEALTQLTDAEYASTIAGIIKMRMGTQFCTSLIRRAFRSSDFGFYASTNLARIAGLIRLYYYSGTISEFMQAQELYAGYQEDLYAYAIVRKDPEILALIRDMILGNNNTLLRREVITSVIISGNEELIDLLMNLLLAAKNQEGIRQAILESADAGSLNTFLRIFKVCMDNDLFRFSSAARALYTWTGVFTEELDIKETRRLAETAYRCLTDEAYRKDMLVSPNPYEAYFAVWSMGCKEVREMDAYVEALLNDDQKYRRILGWYLITGVTNSKYCHDMAVKYLNEPDDEVLAYVVQNLHVIGKACYFYSYHASETTFEPIPDKHYPETHKDRLALFEQLHQLVIRIGNKKMHFSGTPFPWSTNDLSNDSSNVLKCMLSLAAYDMDSQMIDVLFTLLEYMNPDERSSFYNNFLKPDEIPAHREYLYLALNDRSMETRKHSIEKLAMCKPVPADVEHVAAVLQSKSAALRKTAVSYLKDLALPLRVHAVELLAKGSDGELQAAMELMIADEALADAFTELIDSLPSRKLSSQAELLLNQLVKADASSEEYGPENGYGLYDSNSLDEFAKDLDSDPSLAFSDAENSTSFRYLTREEIYAMFPDEEEISAVFAALNEVFVKHRDYEYSVLTFEGTREQVLFGNMTYSIAIPEEFGNFQKGNAAADARLYMVPFADEFRSVLKPYIEDPYRLLGFSAYVTQYRNMEQDYDEPWLNTIREKAVIKNKQIFTDLYKYRNQCFRQLLRMAFEECPVDLRFEAAARFYFSLYHLLGDGFITHMLEPLKRSFALLHKEEDMIFSDTVIKLVSMELNDDQFRHWFLWEYRLKRPIHFINCHLRYGDFLRAVDLGLITEDAFCEWLLEPERKGFRDITRLTSLYLPAYKPVIEMYPWLPALSEKVTDHIVHYEMRRGQAETPISGKVSEVQRIVGLEYFDQLLRALGKENFFRGYAWYNDYTKASVLSLLLRRCIPAREDNAAKLSELLKGSDIKEGRLVEAAMYAPQWAPIIEEYIGWKGLKKGVWFFQAHCSEAFSSDKETEVALFSPITPQEFNDGAFDIDWFRSAYEELGAKRFQALYKAAKYITEGSNAHRRSQLYTDAVTGKFTVEELEAEISDKRNQEKLRAYALIPLLSNSDSETAALLHRYEFIVKYKKESRQFGAARRESEKKAADTALANLAVTCGIRDVERMLWRLESAKNAELLPLMTPVELEGYSVKLRVDEEGTPSIVVEKDGKELKTMPKALAKDEYIEQLKQAVKDLRDQKSRGKATLEQSMINRTYFAEEEIRNILSSLVIRPMAMKLLWINEAGNIGALTDEMFRGQALRIAHCHDLAKSGQWGQFIHDAFENKLVQPFKQIFREYYPITDEEREEKMLSRRYAGYQVQPKKTMGVLKSCGWTVDYEEGLQKVCYSSDLVVRMYSNADWFSPADIEAPTLEEIRFYKRRTFEPVALEDIDPIIFSEVMRDFDLVVSTAYVGDVDPEASHSTVEMRAAIAEELSKLLKLQNVTFLERHARIVGKLGDYSVHLGSGVVHAAGIGMIPILPVHSQHRGRIFLPFADDDPKTAEIISKIILLSEDEKIKDPEILKYFS